VAALLGEASVLMRQHGWLLFALADAALIVGFALWLDWPLLYPLAALTFPAWALLDNRPEVRALMSRLFGD
jgi:hypothetical protein